ncbi:MAG: ABC transporter substrate-binding protein [Thermodesulfobacteriota bacterium]|nr:ABC transporter substrate-binding protein [Thermodesulfobacteriota bacterium]
MTKSHRHFLVWVFVVLAGAFHFHCARDVEWPKDALVVGMVSAPNNMDPRYGLDATSLRTAQVMFNGLVRFDEQAEFLPDLAERWEKADSTTYVFYLKKGVTFHDGTPFTAADVAYTYQSIMDPENNSPRRETYRVIDKIEAEDEYTVRFALKEPFSPFLASMTGGIVPKGAEKMGDAFARHPVGTGPFRFKHLIPGQEIAFEPFEGFHEGRPGLSLLVFRFIPDDTTRLLEFKRGTIQFTQNTTPPDMVAPLSKGPDVEVLITPGTNYAYMGFNVRDPALKNKEVRQAIAMAIDVEAMITYLLRGNAIQATGMLSPQHWAYEGEVAQYPYNPKRARVLLDQAGFPVTETDKGARGLTFLYKTSQDDLARRKAELVKEYLNKIGVEIDIRTYDWATFYTDIRTGNFQIYSLEWVGINDPDMYYYLFHSNCFPPTGANRGHYSDPAVDEWIEAARRTADRWTRKELYGRIQKRLAQDLAYMSLWHPHNIVLMRKGLKGFVPYPTGDFRSMWKVFWDEGGEKG